jgi:membrane-associated phospholipid phosphatase
VDHSILYLFNQTLASPAMDAVMSALTSVWWWMPVYVIAGVYLIAKYKLRGATLLLGAIVVVAFSDQIAQLLIKPTFDRPRPCALIGEARAVEWIRLPVGERQGPSFPSSHALNNAAVAMFFGLAFRSRLLFGLLFAAATLIGISRMYLGLHYPSDILGGLIIGSLIGWILSLLYRKALPQRLHIDTRHVA